MKTKANNHLVMGLFAAAIGLSGISCNNATTKSGEQGGDSLTLSGLNRANFKTNSTDWEPSTFQTITNT